jgi:predicted 3-demethylubiquinone-9 3-methyltransferase (glyoxalase superfamily)
MPFQKITPFLWFDHQAEEAARFYTSIFPMLAMKKLDIRALREAYDKS